MPKPTPYTLTIGDQNFSSWSLRAWLAMKSTKAPFETRKIKLHATSTKEEIAKFSPSGLVPVLEQGELRIWDSLAIGETLAEHFPAAQLWPQDSTARALARAVTCEMHSGFLALRQQLPMQCHGADLKRFQNGDSACQQSIARIQTIWSECLKRQPQGGDYLFGAWSLADCAYAPVVVRFKTYEVPLQAVCEQYANRVWQRPEMQLWLQEASHEQR